MPRRPGRRLQEVRDIRGLSAEKYDRRLQEARRIATEAASRKEVAGSAPRFFTRYARLTQAQDHVDGFSRGPDIGGLLTIAVIVGVIGFAIAAYEGSLWQRLTTRRGAARSSPRCSTAGKPWRRATGGAPALLVSHEASGPRSGGSRPASRSAGVLPGERERLRSAPQLGGLPAARPGQQTVAASRGALP